MVGGVTVETTSLTKEKKQINVSSGFQFEKIEIKDGDDDDDDQVEMGEVVPIL